MNLTRLGRFEILREIGKGAMGQVFLAHDPKIQRQVAIKTIVLPPGTSPEETHETSQRFLREAQAAGRLLHPNIVTIFDVGEEQGVSFIAMEFIEGETLERYTKPEHLLPLVRVRDLIDQAASALDYAHQSGIVHRDVKPANLMVLKNGVLKVTDFGLAKNPSTNLTQAGVLLGTPNYMSPEQIQGLDLDGRSDLFSLGVVLYELLTGVRPFDGDSISTVIYRVLYEDPRPPVARNPALPPEVNGILERALAKSPDRRYARGADLVADLARAFADLPPGTLARPLAGATRAAAGARTERGDRREGTPTLVKNRGEADRARRAGRRDAGAPMRGDRAANGAPPRPTFFARHPIKIAALVVTALVGLTFFPRGANRSERSTLMAGLTAEAPGRGAPLSPAGLGTLPDAGGAPGSGAGGPGGAAGLPGGAGVFGNQVVVDVATMPHGGAIFLDDTPLAEPRVVLALADPKPHDITARAGCRYAAAEMTAADLASFKGAIVLEMQPRVEDVAVGSDPAGARIHVNGKDTGRTTPASVSLQGCEERSVALQRDGFRPWSGSWDADDDFDAMKATLGSVRLEPIPKGTLLIKKPAGYDADIYAGETKLGKAGQTIALPEGKHTLTFRNDEMFVRESLTITVTGGRDNTPLVALPALGTLTVQAQPSNCKVYVDGVYVDVTPVLERPLGAGGHRVKVVFVPSGAEQEVPVSVAGGKNSLVTVKF